VKQKQNRACQPRHHIVEMYASAAVSFIHLHTADGALWQERIIVLLFTDDNFKSNQNQIKFIIQQRANQPLTS